MISIQCRCGGTITCGEDDPGSDLQCPECGQSVRIACAETLAPGAGEGDFDAMLIQRGGPEAGGPSGCIALGGCTDISIGRLP